MLATHQPLRIPHDRLTVTAVDPMPTSDGIAYTATLRLDGQPVGAVEHTGDGSTVFHPAGHGLGRTDLDVFVDACRWRGRAASRETVLQALVLTHADDIRDHETHLARCRILAAQAFPPPKPRRRPPRPAPVGRPLIDVLDRE